MGTFIRRIIQTCREICNHKIEQNVITFGICLLIATTLWFLNALNKEYTIKISYPVKYTELPKGKLLVSELPKEISLEIKAHGFALLRYRISTSFLPIVFNVNTYTNGAIEKRNLQEYTVNLNEIKDKLSSQLNSDLNLISIEPSSIYFRFSPASSKKLAIIPQVNYTLKKQYILKHSISVSPQQVVVSGPKTLLDTLQAVYTKPLNLKDIAKDIQKTVQLEEITGARFANNEVEINIEVERFTESRRSIPLTIRNLPDSLKLQLFPNSVDVTFEVGLSHYDHVSDTSFIFSVDYQQIKDFPERLPIKIEKRPTFIQNFTYTPEHVEFLIEKKYE